MLLRFLARNKRAVLIAAVCAVAVILMTTSWRSDRETGPVDEGVMFLAAPLLKASSSVNRFRKGLTDFLFGWRDLKEENRLLKEHVARLERHAEEHREQELAYRRLAAMLEFRQATGHRMTVAAVIGHDTTNLFRTILINKGRLDGLARDMAVVTPEGVVGKTIKVFPRSAQVLLLTDLSSGIDALVQRTRDQGVVQGLGSQWCEMKYLSRQSAVAVGDDVVTTGMGGVFPKGVRIGRVTNVRKGGSLLQKVEIRPSAKMDSLEEVMVLLGGEEGA